MNKVLDLVAAIEDDNFGYTTNVSVPKNNEIDCLINCTKFFSTEDNFLGSSFSYDKINDLKSEFEDISITSYVTKGHPDGIGGDNILQHEVEIEVVE